jgi:hypothetical protein
VAVSSVESGEDEVLGKQSHFICGVNWEKYHYSFILQFYHKILPYNKGVSNECDQDMKAKDYEMKIQLIRMLSITFIVLITQGDKPEQLLYFVKILSCKSINSYSYKFLLHSRTT